MRSANEHVAGSYVIVRPLGATTLGAYYLARAPDGGAVVYREAMLDSPSDWRALERFEAMARVLRGLDHPRIARVLEWARAPGGRGPSYSVEQPVDGDPLTVKLVGWRPSEVDARRMAHDLLDALVYLQRLTPPIWHHSIDPSRVVCARDGSFHLTDFVAASIPGDDPAPFAGDPDFMAPEQRDGRWTGPGRLPEGVPQGVPLRASVGPSTDVYGVGATVLYGLFRKPPTAVRRGRGAIREGGGLSSAFSRWLARATDPSASNRFADAESALKALIDCDRIERARLGVSGAIAAGVVVLGAIALHLYNEARKDLHELGWLVDGTPASEADVLLASLTKSIRVLRRREGCILAPTTRPVPATFEALKGDRPVTEAEWQAAGFGRLITFRLHARQLNQYQWINDQFTPEGSLVIGRLPHGHLTAVLDQNRDGLPDTEFVVRIDCDSSCQCVTGEREEHDLPAAPALEPR
jgi:hypothetical protein